MDDSLVLIFNSDIEYYSNKLFRLKVDENVKISKCYLESIELKLNKLHESLLDIFKTSCNVTKSFSNLLNKCEILISELKRLKIKLKLSVINKRD